MVGLAAVELQRLKGVWRLRTAFANFQQANRQSSAHTHYKWKVVFTRQVFSN